MWRGEKVVEKEGFKGVIKGKIIEGPESDNRIIRELLETDQIKNKKVIRETMGA